MRFGYQLYDSIEVERINKIQIGLEKVKEQNQTDLNLRFVCTLDGLFSFLTGNQKRQ